MNLILPPLIWASASGSSSGPSQSTTQIAPSAPNLLWILDFQNLVFGQ